MECRTPQSIFRISILLLGSLWQNMCFGLKLQFTGSQGSIQWSRMAFQGTGRTEKEAWDAQFHLFLSSISFCWLNVLSANSISWFYHPVWRDLDVEERHSHIFLASSMIFLVVVGCLIAHLGRIQSSRRAARKHLESWISSFPVQQSEKLLEVGKLWQMTDQLWMPLKNQRLRKMIACNNPTETDNQFTCLLPDSNHMTTPARQLFDMLRITSSWFH